jgi:hypothetical protein
MQSPASRKFLKSSLSVWLGDFVLFGTADYLVDHLHPSGVTLWLLAAMPVLPVVVFVALLGRYLHEERDGYERPRRPLPALGHRRRRHRQFVLRLPAHLRLEGADVPIRGFLHLRHHDGVGEDLLSYRHPGARR